MISIRELITIVVALALLVAMVPTVTLASIDQTAGQLAGTNAKLDVSNATGQFAAANVDPTVGNVTIWNDTHSSTVSGMTPQTEYAAKVTVTDANKLNDLTNVTVTIFYDADGDDDSGDVPGSGDTQNAAIITWIKSGDSWSIDPSASTTWVLESGNCSHSGLGNSTGDFWFHFKPGKVSTENTAFDWDAYGEVDDSGGTPGTYYDASDYDMYWYGEITLGNSTVNWGTVAPGTDFGNSTKQGDIEVNYIANGPYDEEVAATGTWTGATANATLDATGSCTNSNEFAMKANDTDNLTGAVLVDTSYTAIDDTGTQTSESGAQVNTNTLWLKLAATFSDETYTGTIYYQIANGT